MNQDMLQKFADVLVRVGINLQPGENVVIYGGTESPELVRAIVRSCWESDAHDVIVRWSDVDVTRWKYELASEDALAFVPAFAVDEREAMFQNKYHRISVGAPYLNAFSHIEQSRIRTAQQAGNAAFDKLWKYFDAGDVKWVVGAAPNARWAQAIYPELDRERALEALWNDVLYMSRIDVDDPVAAWKAHDASLKAYERRLDEYCFKTLHYEGPGTDLVVDLADEHKWIGGSSATPEGIAYMANIPTEEIFTTPHAMRCEGTVRATKPLSLMGKIVEGFGFTFEAGRVVDCYADANVDVLESLLEMDEGARRLGEVAIVPNSSPISQLDRVYRSTLVDENASCHFALGNAYAEAIVDGADRTEDERKALGSNRSMVHVDFMVGGPELKITGTRHDGSVVEILRDGEWAFDV
jgi:aminopeptidase